MTTPVVSFADLAQSYRQAAEMLQRKDEIARQIDELKAEDKHLNRALRKLKTGVMKSSLDDAVAATPDPGPDPVVP